MTDFLLGAGYLFITFALLAATVVFFIAGALLVLEGQGREKLRGLVSWAVLAILLSAAKTWL